TIPKHKGTEKMQGDIKRRIAKLRDETQRRSASKRRPFYLVEKQGAGQIVLVGPPNSGKSQLLASLSNAEPEIAPYPFTTRAPLTGMVQFENVQIQLVDLPPLAPEGSPPWLIQVIRPADAIVLVFDLGDDNLLDHFETTLTLLENGRVYVGAAATDPGVTVFRKKAVIVGNKLDAPGAADRLDLLMEACEGIFPAQVRGESPVLPVSATMGSGLEELKRRMYDVLGVIRVYTKAPGKPVDDSAPFVLKKGATILEAASTVHKEIAQRLKYARVWGKSTYEGQMVQRDYVLSEGDIVEFHT
ncbi:MAG: GTPase, partial [Bacillota bacterium]